MEFRSMILFSILIFINLTLDCEALFNPCPYGNPLAGSNCGLGGHSCPHYYYCEASPVDAYALCCPDYCSSGKPMMDANNQPVHCGRGGMPCPDDYACHVAPTDAWAVCCPNV